LHPRRKKERELEQKEEKRKKKEKKSSLIGTRRHKIWRTQLQGASARQGRKSIHIRGQASKATNIFCLWTKEGLTVCRAQKCGRVAANEAVLSKRNPLIMVPHCTDWKKHLGRRTESKRKKERKIWHTPVKFPKHKLTTPSRRKQRSNQLLFPVPFLNAPRGSSWLTKLWSWLAIVVSLRLELEFLWVFLSQISFLTSRSALLLCQLVSGFRIKPQWKLWIRRIVMIFAWFLWRKEDEWTWYSARNSLQIFSFFIIFFFYFLKILCRVSICWILIQVWGSLCTSNWSCRRLCWGRPLSGRCL